MVALLVILMLGIAGRLLHVHRPGTDAYAGYLMAGCGFLALAHTLKRGEHIRVTLLSGRLQDRAKRALALWALGAATALAGLLAPWVQALPGRLLHTNVIGCTIFAAVSGSSAATSATIGKMTLPELKRRGYPDDIAIGSLAGAGTLGLLIPPSIIMIVYGGSADVSIAKLFMAGVLPGVMLATLFSGYLVVWAGRCSTRARCQRLMHR